MMGIRRAIALWICPDLKSSSALRDQGVTQLTEPDCRVLSPDILVLAEMYSANTGLRLTTISSYAANDGKFFGSLSAGKTCTLKRASRVTRWFSDNWPDDLAWPSDIPRPPRAEGAQ